MKRISLTELETNLLENALLEYGAVVTFDQFTSLLDEDRAYTRIRISKLANQGWLTRVKKGIFVISDLSSRGTLAISHYAVTNILVEEAYLSFEAALQYHGLYDQLLGNINAISMKRHKTTLVDRITYHFIYTQEKYFYGWEAHLLDGQTVKIASKEKALIDLIQYHRNRYSADLVYEKLKEFKSDLNYQKMVEYTLKANLTTQRIMGLLMDCVALDSAPIYRAISDRKSVSFLSQSTNNLYNNKWKLYYDQYFSRYVKATLNQATA